MNEQVVKQLRKKIRKHADERFAVLKDKLVTMAKPTEESCLNHDCLDGIKSLVNGVHNFIGNLAISHGIDPHELIRETLTLMLEGNEYAHTLQKTAEAFKDDETVGFC